MIRSDLVLGEAYALLHLVPGAPERVVRAAYRAVAQEVHPDHGGSAVAFQQVEAAMRLIEARGFPLGPLLEEPRRARRRRPRRGALRPVRARDAPAPGAHERALREVRAAHRAEGGARACVRGGVARLLG